MATYTVRGNAHNVIYSYKESGKRKQHWETYTTELEAMQRKAFIDYLQKNKKNNEIVNAAAEYKQKRIAEKAEQEIADKETAEPASPTSVGEGNTERTYREFAEKWLPFHARKKRFSPVTYDTYMGNLKNHILPYFGDRVMSTITSEDIDSFVDHLSRKPCRGMERHTVTLKDMPTLSSASVKKCYTILTAGFRAAKKWGYINNIPETTAPVEKTKKRKAWTPEQVFSMLSKSAGEELLCLTVHLAFVCSLRAGETVGISLKTIDFHDGSLWITQEVQRVSDQALRDLPENEIIHVFPKKISGTKTSLILKALKTEGSHRKQYLTTPLLRDIRERLKQIERNKAHFGTAYHDNGLLICMPDGQPIESKALNSFFKNWQRKHGIVEQIEFQGLRKSGQMHKVRLSKNNYQLVAENSGQSPEVLMSNYNETLDSEKRTLALMVETSFYPREAGGHTVPQASEDVDAVLKVIQSNPELSQKILQTLLFQATGAQQDTIGP